MDVIPISLQQETKSFAIQYISPKTDQEDCFQQPLSWGLTGEMEDQLPQSEQHPQRRTFFRDCMPWQDTIR
ncbi:MAG TPA: hypothetical protein DEF43_09605 [Chloroflexus aurantiacus]|nr:MAG: hypothetical protein D6716_02245 [Chloroflexota bacterium]HBW67400.1 hypothetical protein [Chloroflexus aurantiacus]